MQQESSNQLVDHLFRHEAGKMIAVLTRLLGTHHLTLAEDVVQEAFLKAAQSWAFNKVPDNPSGWLMQVARNKAIDIIRRQQHFQQYSGALTAHLHQDVATAIEPFFLEHEIADSQLQMIFACCHPALKEEDKVALTLKVVSGFSSAEIAKALVTNEMTIQKRLYRARQFLKVHHIQLEIPAGPSLNTRLETVYTVLYLLFNEGYNSQKADELIRKDLCAEAMRLALLLSEHKTGNRPATFALLALMCFQVSRFDSRMNDDHSIVLLQYQDRSKWNQALIRKGYEFLNYSSQGDELTVYHIESAIAAEHCMTTCFSETNWERMLSLYDLLLEKKRTPMVVLNRAIVLAQLKNSVMAIKEIESIHEIDTLLQTHYIFSAVLGDLYLQTGNTSKAKALLEIACQLTHSVAEKKLMVDKISKCENY